jgi:pimeloyl-ACP methyl ester carboxylesterase
VSQRRRRIVGAAAALGATAAAVATGVVVERRVVAARRAGAAGAEELGSLHSPARPVRTADGVLLHAEVDEVSPHGPREDEDAGPTLVFVHGYALNLDCWHFQRQHFRGKRRMVFYDQRSHGRSTRSPAQNATIDQLGHDLKTVLDQLVPDGRVVLVGHSMGGMTIMALAEQHPELFGDRVAGVGLISTAAGGLRSHKAFGRLLPEKVMAALMPRVVAGLARAPEAVDRVRRHGTNLGFVATGRFAFGDAVPASYVEFVDEMLAQTPFDVLAEFFPNFDRHDKFAVLHAFEKVPTTIVCGTRDLLTAIGHSRKMASRLPSARLVECFGAGHMVILERKDKVNAALDELLAQVETGGDRAAAAAAARGAS